MKLCSRCLQKADLKVSQPQMVKVSIGCDGCGEEKRKAYSVVDVVKQGLLSG